MKKIKLTYLILIIGLLSCQDKSNDSKTIYLDKFKWKITIPDNFNRVKTKDWEELQKKGENAIENTVGQDIVNYSTTIFVYKNGQFNTFESNYQPFDPEVDGDYLESCKGVNDLLYKTFESQIPGAILDSISSFELINGLEFHRFDINLDLPNGIKMKTTEFSRLFDKYDFTVNITYIDEKYGNLMFDSFKNSTFN